MKQVNFLIKPASSLCNMRCQYCFYADEATNRMAASMGIMTQQTSHTLISQAMELVDPNGVITFAFQGGEPTLSGLNFYRIFVATVREENRKNARIFYAIQTNALCLDADWAEFFAQNHFLVGISLDGDKTIHDEFRLDAAGNPTWNRIRSNIALLQKYRVNMNALCVVTKRCARSPVKIYNNLKRLGFRHLQFIPCLDPLNVERGNLPYSLTPEAYGSFLCGLFDVWYRDWKNGDYVSIRLFEDYVYLMMRMPGGTCSTSGCCGQYLVVEGDGSLYPCDFYCLDEWRIGRISETTLAEALTSPAFIRFLQSGQLQPDACGVCQWKKLCNGGCKRDWIWRLEGPKNYLCPAFFSFFTYADKKLQQVAEAEWNARNYWKGKSL